MPAHQREVIQPEGEPCIETFAIHATVNLSVAMYGVTFRPVLCCE